jgi:hypothetical protein
VKFIFALLFLLVSPYANACKIVGDMNISSFYMKGLLEKLTHDTAFASFHIKSVKRIKYNEFSVVVENVEESLCLELAMKAYTEKMCKFAANVTQRNEIPCK